MLIRSLSRRPWQRGESCSWLMKTSTALILGTAVGMVGGAVLAQQSMGKHGRDLFSGRPLRRLAALGHLSGHPSVDTVRLLNDYIAWEDKPMLKRRARSIARRMEGELA